MENSKADTCKFGFFFSHPSALLHSKESEANDKNTYEEDITDENAVASI